MSEQNNELFGKTFDQQVNIAGNEIDKRDISPNRCIKGEIVFEPVFNGVRVTARDEHHKLLWGFIGSRETLNNVHNTMAAYTRLQEYLGEELKKSNLGASSNPDPMSAADTALSKLENAVKELRHTLQVKKISDATLKRANMVTQIANDATSNIAMDVSFFNVNKKGNK